MPYLVKVSSLDYFSGVFFREFVKTVYFLFPAAIFTAGILKNSFSLQELIFLYIMFLNILILNFGEGRSEKLKFINAKSLFDIKKRAGGGEVYYNLIPLSHRKHFLAFQIMHGFSGIKISSTSPSPIRTLTILHRNPNRSGASWFTSAFCNEISNR